MNRAFAAFAIGVLMLSPVSATARSGPHYGGGHHTYSHGGHYSGGSGSSHRGGHYVNLRTSNRYGCHKCR